MDDFHNADSVPAAVANRQELLEYIPQDRLCDVGGSTAWRVAAASVIGPLHVKAGTPRQDAFAFGFSGDVVVGCVADGLGSHGRSHIGSKIATERVVADLVTGIEAVAAEDLERELRAGGDGALGEMVRSAIVRAVRETEALMAIQPGPGFATTLVGVVASPAYGFFFHVGDGIALSHPTDVMMPGQLPMPASQTVSFPENGEFDNITYAITAKPDDPHLRFTPVATPRLIVLMTDGPMPFAIAKDQRSLAEGLFRPINAQLWSEIGLSQGGAMLEGVLADPRAGQISDDDKTFLIVRHMKSEAAR